MNKTDTKSTVLLKHHLKALKLPTMHAECEKIAQRCAWKMPCWARVMMAQASRTAISTTPITDPISEVRRALGPGTS